MDGLLRCLPSRRVKNRLWPWIPLPEKRSQIKNFSYYRMNFFKIKCTDDFFNLIRTFVLRNITYIIKINQKVNQTKGNFQKISWEQTNVYLCGIWFKQLVLSMTLWIFLQPKRWCICAQEKGLSDKIVKVEMGIQSTRGVKCREICLTKDCEQHKKKWI